MSQNAPEQPFSRTLVSVLNVLHSQQDQTKLRRHPESREIQPERPGELTGSLLRNFDVENAASQKSRSNPNTAFPDPLSSLSTPPSRTQLQHRTGAFKMCLILARMGYLHYAAGDENDIKWETLKRYSFDFSILPHYTLFCRGVAQYGSAPRLGRGGRRFEFARPD